MIVTMSVLVNVLSYGTDFRSPNALVLQLFLFLFFLYSQLGLQKIWSLLRLMLIKMTFVLSSSRHSMYVIWSPTFPPSKCHLCTSCLWHLKFLREKFQTLFREKLDNCLPKLKAFWAPDIKGWLWQIKYVFLLYWELSHHFRDGVCMETAIHF